MPITLVRAVKAAVANDDLIEVTVSGVAGGNSLVFAFTAWMPNSETLPAPELISLPGLGWSKDADSGARAAGGGTERAAIYAVHGVPGGSYTVSAAMPYGSYAVASITEWADFLSAAALDRTAGSTGDHTGPVSPPISVTVGPTLATSQGNEIVLALLGGTNYGEALFGATLPAGFTNAALENDANLLHGHRLDYRLISTAGPQTVTWPGLNGRQAWAAAMATYRSAEVPTGLVAGANFFVTSQLLPGVSASEDLSRMDAAASSSLLVANSSAAPANLAGSVIAGIGPAAMLTAGMALLPGGVVATQSGAVTGVLLALPAGLLPGAVVLAKQSVMAGAVLTPAAVLLPGAIQRGDSSSDVAGTTLTRPATLIAGAVQAVRSATPATPTLVLPATFAAGSAAAVRVNQAGGITLTLAATLAAGAGTAAQQAATGGQVLAAVVTLDAGGATATRAATAGGIVLPAGGALIPGGITPAIQSEVPGQILALGAGVIATGAVGSRTAAPSGLTFTVGFGVTPGEVSTTSQSVVVGRTLATEAALLDGASSTVRSALAGGGTLLAGASISGGGAAGIRTAEGPKIILPAGAAVLAGGVTTTSNNEAGGGLLGCLMAFRPGAFVARRTAVPGGDAFEIGSSLLPGSVAATFTIAAVMARFGPRRRSQTTEPAPIERYIVGDDARLRVYFLGEDGVTPISATGVRIIVRNPAGQVQQYEGVQVSSDEMGVFYVDYRVALIGRHYVRADCVGPTVGVAETRFDGVRSQVVA